MEVLRQKRRKTTLRKKKRKKKTKLSSTYRLKKVCNCVQCQKVSNFIKTFLCGGVCFKQINSPASVLKFVCTPAPGECYHVIT